MDRQDAAPPLAPTLPPAIPADAGLRELLAAYLAGLGPQFRSLGGLFALFLAPFLFVLGCVLYVRFTTEPLPRGATGKILKKAIRAQAAKELAET